jgi:hypothetical protein
MPYVPVSSYEVDWYPKTNQNRIAIHIASSPNPWQPQITTEAEFVAILLMLGKQGVQVDTANGAFKVPQRSAGT